MRPHHRAEAAQAGAVDARGAPLRDPAGDLLVPQAPRREREVFALCAWSGLSYEDAAVALEIPVGTVRSRLSRARARLQELDPGSGHEGDRMQAIKEAVER